MEHITPYKTQIDNYYEELVAQLKPNSSSVESLVISHMVPNALSFIPAMNAIAPVCTILPKPKSKERPETAILSADFPIADLTRDWAENPSLVVAYLESLNLNGKDLILVDIGGYFSESATEIASTYSGNIIGIIEGTENGVQKYEGSSSMKGAANAPPVITTGRSPLKLPEDYLVASGIVFSTEAVLRQEVHEPIETRQACVIGFGRVGSSIAHILRGRGITTDIFDTDPIKLAEAAARGFVAHRTLSDAIKNKSLVMCATGDKSLGAHDFQSLKNGCCVASVTSSDDEFDLSEIHESFVTSNSTDNLTIYNSKDSSDPKSFWMIANGNAANFIHGAVIGPAMQLIEGEKLAAVKSLIDGSFVRLQGSSAGLYEVNQADRTLVAEAWNKYFL